MSQNTRTEESKPLLDIMKTPEQSAEEFLEEVMGNVAEEMESIVKERINYCEAMIRKRVANEFVKELQQRVITENASVGFKREPSLDGQITAIDRLPSNGDSCTLRKKQSYQTNHCKERTAIKMGNCYA